MPMPARLHEQLELLSMLQDRSERIQALIDIGEGFVNPNPDEVPRTAWNKVPGCESEVFLNADRTDGEIHFRFAVDNPQGISAMALAQMLQDGLEGAAPEQVRDIPDDVVYEIFGRELSMGKSLGLMNMVRALKAAAASPA